MGEPSLNLVVARCTDLVSARLFYEAVGLTFVDEQHGKGPAHLAARLPSGVVIELYPATDRVVPERGTAGDVRLGFTVDDVADVVRAVERVGGRVVSGPASEDGSVNAVVVDPDGRRVELSSRSVQ